MVLSYVVPTNNPQFPALHTIDNVKDALTELLKQEIGKNYVSAAWNGDDLVLNVEKAGRSEVLIGVCANPDGSVQIYEKKRNLAWLHRAFAGQAESMFDGIIKRRLGAKRVS